MFQQPNNDVHPTFSNSTAERRSGTLIILTSLIDVMFVLLLYFMMATNFNGLHAITLDAPAASASAQPSEQPGALLIQVRLDGFRFGGRYMPLDEIANLVRERLHTHPQLRVLVQPGAGVSLQRTVHVLDRLSAVGADRLSLMQSPGNHTLRQ